MQRPPSITTNEALLNYLKGLENRVNKVENKGTGTIGFIDEATGVETIIGTLPDGSVGLQEWINDTTPPEQPSAPVVTAGVAFLRVAWNGLDTLGNQPPKDYDKTIVEKSVNGVDGWTAVEELRGNASTNVGSVSNSSPTYFRLVSVDKNGNRSTPSSVASGTALYETPETTQAIAEAIEAAQNADDLASSKIKVYFQPSSPALTGNTFGDTWFDTDEGNKVYVWTGSAWTSAQDAKIPALEDLASSKIKSYVQATSPALTGNTYGDTWYNTSEGNKIYIWTGSAWTSAQDAKIPALEDLASSKIKTHFQASTPPLTGNTFGDVWFDTDEGNKIHVWNGNAWTSAQDQKIPAIESLASSKIKTYVQSSSPALTGNTFGDTWYNTSEGNKIYVWTGSAWTNAQDQKIPAIESLASSKIKVHFQSAQPALTGNTFGDTWFDTDEGNKVYVWNGSAWTNAQDQKIPAIESLASSKIKVYHQASSPALTGNTFGDTWYDTDDGNKPYIWTGSAWTNAQDQKIISVESVATSKTKTFFQTSAPATTGRVTGDTWFDTDDGNKIYVWNGSAWTDAQDDEIGAAKQAAQNASDLASTKIKVYYQASSPALTGNTFGDTWFDTDDGNKPYVWNGSAWSSAQDQSIVAAKDLASSKTKTYYQTSTPPTTGRIVGDTWFDTDEGNKIYVWNGSAWTSAQDAAITAANDLASSKIKVYFQTNQPALTGNTFGDTWFDTDAGNKVYVWNGSAWTSAQDTSIATAQSTATSALTSANGKNKTYFQASSPALTGNVAGDTWFDTDDGNKIYVWNGSAWTDAQDDAILTAQSTASSALANAASADSKAVSATNIANSKNVIISSTSAPATTGRIAGDTWFDTDDGNKPYVFNGTTWLSVQDSAIAAASGLANTALSTANGKNKTYFQTEAPGLTGNTLGDTWFDTNDGNKVYVWNGSAWASARDSDISTALNSANGKNKTYYQNDQPSGGTYITGDTWFDTNDNYKLYTYTGSTWQLAQDAVGAKNDAIAAAQSEVDKAFAASRTYLNNATSVEDLVILQGAAPTVVDSSTASGGKALQKTGANHLWMHDNRAKQVFDPTALYRLSARIRVSASATSGGKGFYWGFAGLAADGVTYVNSSGANTYSSQQWGISNTQVPVDGNWVDYVTYVKGLSATTPTGAGTLSDPRKLHANTRYVVPSMILDYPTGNGTWEISHWSVDVVDSEAQQAMLEKSQSFHQTSMPTGGSYKKGDIWFDTDDGNKVYVHNGTTFVLSQDLDIQKSLAAGHSMDWDINQPNKWAYTKYIKTTSSSHSPTYSDFSGLTGVTTLVTDTANLVQSQGDNYIGQLRAIVNVAATKTVSWTMTHDDGARVYVDGVSVYSNPVFTSNAAVSFSLTAGWHVIDILWAEAAGGDGITAFTPLLSTQVTNMYAPVSLTDASATATNALTAANGKNKVIWNTSPASGTTGYSAGDIWFQTASGIIIGQWEFTTSWQSRTIDNAVIANLNAGKITAGTLDAARIQAGSITADKITIGDFTNLLDDPDFDRGTGWGTNSNMFIEDTVGVEGSTTKALKIVANSSTLDSTNKNVIPVTGGDKFYVSIYVKSDGVATAGDIHFGTTVTFADGSVGWPAIPGMAVSAASVGTSWVKLSGVLTIPTNAVKLMFRASVRNNVTAGSFWWDHAVVRRQNTAVTIADGTIAADSAIIQNGAIGNAHIADLAVGTAEIQNAAVTNAKIEDLAVTNAKIADATIESAKISQLDAGKITTGELDAARIGADTITSGHIASGTITAAELAAGSITASALAAGSITATALSAQSITSTAIATDTITAGNIKAGAITGSELSAGSVSATAIAANSITATALSAQSITATALAAQSITATALGANSITATAIAANSVRASAIRAGEITAAHLTAGSITASAIAAGSIGATALAANSITATALAANSITATALAAQSITATALGAQSIGASAIKAGSITATAMAADSITATAIAAGAVTAQELAAGSITATAIAAGSITASALAAQSITATALGAQSISATAIAAQSITATALAAQSITATALAAQSITASAIKSGSITADALAAGSVTATAVAARAITADKVVISSGANLLPDPTFRDSATNQSRMDRSTGTWTLTTDATGLPVMQAATTGSANFYYSPVAPNDAANVASMLPAIPGQRYSLRVTVDTDITSAQVRWNAWLHKKDGTYSYVGLGSLVYATGKRLVTVEYEIPADVVAWYPQVTNYNATPQYRIYADAEVALMNQGHLIVDGAITADKIKAGEISAAHLSAGAITATALAANSITATALAAQSVSATALAAQSVTATAIAANTITASALAAGSITATAIGAGSITATAIGAQSITATALAAQSITATALAAQSIGASAIKAGSITATAMAADSITATAIAANAVTATELAASSITATAIAANSITASALAAQSITATALAAGSITATAIAAQSITATALAAQSITATAIGAQSIGASAIKAQSITATALAADSVTASAIGAQQVTATELAANSITATAIAANSITASALAAQSITATALGAGSITATAIRANSITATAIAGQSITATALAANSVTASAIKAGSITATALAADSITATAISGKTITADKLVMTSTDNLVLEGDFSNSGNSWGMGANKSINATAGRGSLPAMRITGVTTEVTSVNLINKVSVGTEDRFRGALWFKSSDTLSAGAVQLKAKCYTSATTVASDVVISSSPAVTGTNVWTNAVGISPALPSGTIALEFYLSVTNPTTTVITDIDYVSVTRAADASLVVDGAINGQTITGATIQTAEAGARIILDENGLNGWDANGINYLQADADGLTMTGKLISGGETDEATPRPMRTVIGNHPLGTITTYDQLGIHFIREDTVGNTDIWQPRITSGTGESVDIFSGKLEGQTYGDSYVTVTPDRVQAWSGGIDGVSLETGMAQIAVRDGFIWMNSASYNIWAKDEGLEYRIHPTLLPQKAGNSTQLNALFPYGGYAGAAVVRSDLGGITQRYIDGKWTGFSGSVAYVATQNGYSNYARGYPTTHAYLGPDGRTYLGGMFGITSTGAVSILANNSYTMGTLPAGYRPPYPVQFITAASHDLGNCTVGIGTDGAISYRLAAAKNLTNGYNQFWISLEGVSWRNTNC